VTAKTVAKPLSTEQPVRSHDPWDDADYFSGAPASAQSVRRRRTWPFRIAWMIIVVGFVAVCADVALDVLLENHGVAPDYMEAVKWLRKAAAQFNSSNIVTTIFSQGGSMTGSGTKPVSFSQQNSAVFTETIAELPKLNATAITIAQLAIDPSEWPKEVTLNQKVSFPIIIDCQNHGTGVMPSGIKLKLVAVEGEVCKLAYGATTQLVPATNTDLATQVIAAREAAGRVIAQRKENTAAAQQRTKCPAPLGFPRKSEPDNMAAQSTCNNTFYKVTDYINHRAQLYGKRVTVRGELTQCGTGMHSEGDWYMLEGKLDCRFRIGSRCTDGSSNEDSGHRIVTITGTAYEDLAHLGIPKLVDCDCPDSGMGWNRWSR